MHPACTTLGDHAGKLAVSLATASLLTGCGSVLVSKPAVSGASGLAYALPKAQVQVVAQRRKVDAETVDATQKNLADAKVALAASRAKLDTLKASRDRAKALAEVATSRARAPGATDADRAAESALAKELAIATIAAELQQAHATKSASDASAAKAAADLVVGQVGQWVETVTLAVLPSVPDPDRRFVIQHQESGARDDKFKLEVTGGLLSSGSSESTGQASAIVLNLVRSFGALREGSSARSSRLLRLESAPRSAGGDDCKHYKLSLTFDPTRPDEVRNARTALSTQALKLNTSAMPSTTAPAGHVAGAADALPHTEGLMYRALRPVTVSVEPESNAASRAACGNETAAEIAEVSAVLPDAAMELSLPVKGAAFAKSSVKFTFQDGIPTMVDVDRPSPLVAVAGLPIEILKALVSVPAEIIKLRIDYTNQQAAETTALKDLLQAQRDLEALQRKPAD